MRRLVAGLLVAGAAAVTAAPAPAALPEGRAYELVSPLDSRGLNFDEAWGWRDSDHALMLSGFDSQGVHLAQRTPAGWTVRERLIPPPEGWVRFKPLVVDASDDFSRVLMRYALPDGSEADQLGLHEADGTWRTVGSYVTYLARSGDARRVLVAPRAGADPYPGVPTASAVYLWDDGAVRSIGDDDPRVATCGATVGRGDGIRGGVDQSGFSRDGEVVVLVTRSCTDPDTSAPLPPHVVVSVDGQSTDVSAPLDLAADAAATFLGNAVDGSAVWFRTTAQLDAGDAVGSDDLFRYDVADGTLERVTAPFTDAGRTFRSAATADDGGRAWVVTYDAGLDREVLSVWSAGAGLREIAFANRGTLALDASQRASNPTQVSLDGSVVAWIGAPRGTGWPTVTGLQIHRATADGTVRCVTCVDGVGATALATLSAPEGLLAPRVRMSDDGRHIGFETTARLLAEDSDALADVYGWSDGQVWLASAGNEPGAARLAGVSGRGDIFFRSFARLLPWVDDPHGKVWVARIGGGLPAPPAPTTCAGDACQGVPLTAVPGLVPPSQSYEGLGDVDAPELPFRADPRAVARLTLGRIGRATKARLAAGRRATLVVRSTEAGRISATVRARLGRRWLRAGGASRTLADAGSARLSVRLSAAARRQLARTGALRMRVELRQPLAPRAVTASFVLERAGGRR